LRTMLPYVSVIAAAARKAWGNWYVRIISLYGIALAALIWVISRNWYSSPNGTPGLEAILSKQIHWGMFAVGAGLYLAGLLLQFVRWHLLVHAQNLPFTLYNAVRLGLVGFFFNSVLPGSIGGDVVKAASIAYEQERRTVAISTVLIDRAVGLWGLIWLVVLCGGMFWLSGNEAIHAEAGLHSVFLTAAGITAGTVVAWLLLGLLPERRAHRFAGRLGKIPKIGHSIAELWRAIWIYRNKRKSIAAALALSIVTHAFFVGTFFFAAQTFRDPGQELHLPSLAQHFLFVPMGFASEAFIPLPGGMGAGEALFGWFYEMAGAPGANGIAASFARRVITWGWGLVGYLAYLQMKPALGAAKRKVTATQDPIAPVLDITK
jgi:glycosyltransferase 2 family protein